MVICLLENKNNFIHLDNKNFQSSNICKLVLHLIDRLVNTNTLLWCPLGTHHKTSKTSIFLFFEWVDLYRIEGRYLPRRVSVLLEIFSCSPTSFLKIWHFFGAYWSLTCFYCVWCFSRVSRCLQYNCLINCGNLRLRVSATTPLTLQHKPSEVREHKFSLLHLIAVGAALEQHRSRGEEINHKFWSHFCN